LWWEERLGDQPASIQQNVTDVADITDVIIKRGDQP
jgi:hypothetical protein